MNEPDVIRAMLGDPPAEPRTIAVVGLSDKPDRPGNYVPAYMQKHGYRIIPVNPLVETVLGEKAYASLADLPEKPDVVNVFRLPVAFTSSWIAALWWNTAMLASLNSFALV
jgi:predicted CoA-binding protein